MSVRLYVLALITTFSFILVSAGLTAEEWVFVDLKPKANSRLDQQWWTGEKAASTLSFLPIGKTEDFAGPDDKDVKFKIEKECVVVFGTNAAKWPKKITGIKTDPKVQKVSFVYFLHATGWEDNGAPSYKFIIHYDDNSKAELEMQSGINSDDWCHDDSKLQDKNSVWGWVKKEGAPCGHAGLITTRWKSPKPNKGIVSIDIESLGTGAVPVIAGITLGDVLLNVDAQQKLTTKWGTLKGGI
ncbi:TPA: hypothetical protein EYO57_17020 [Candidatus Poribacteria bacterium]|nr:hypothetical protein [Candidatus Poribacteria bacterium]HIO47268.1 hypothetical protein [Candidatus Poribacteria bacterium]